MKLVAFVGCLLTVAPWAVAAQTGAQSYGVAGMENMGSGGQSPVQTATLPNPCPVGVRASHLSDGGVVKTGTMHPKELGQRLHLTLTSPDSRSIASATVNVRGWTAKGRIEQTGKDEGAALPVRTLTVPFTAGADRTASADVWAPGLTAVSSVELISVAFEDGTTWTQAQGKTCQVTPDPLMLVTNR
ncbi:MAG: hypothetical protein ABSD61_10360 [Terracidiphilus sp.]|jgi:hypothetical protein